MRLANTSRKPGALDELPLFFAAAAYGFWVLAEIVLISASSSSAALSQFVTEFGWHIQIAGVISLACLTLVYTCIQGFKNIGIIILILMFAAELIFYFGFAKQIDFAWLTALLYPQSFPFIRLLLVTIGTFLAWAGARKIMIQAGIVSKGFFLGSWAFNGLALLMAVLATLYGSHVEKREAFELFYYSIIPMIYSASVMFIFTYKIWAAIQDGHVSISPKKAVGFLFIPFYNIYWAFKVIWGFSKEYNLFLARHSIKAPALPESLFLTYCILIWLGAIPMVGLYIVAINFVLGWLIINKTCDAINSLPEAVHIKKI